VRRSPAALFDRIAPVLVPGVDDLGRFDQPARGDEGHAAAVVVARTTDEVRAIVRVAVANEVRLLPQGANTGLVGASVAPADPPTVVLSTERLRAAVRVDPAGATATVAAGTLLSELNAAAAEHRLHLPIDLAADPAIGGMIATNTGGSRVLRYGPMRRYVLATEVVTADEDVSVLGGLRAVRKDSRGLDATQLAIGSGGTLGIVTGAVLGLVAVPRSIETWWLAVDDPLRVTELLTRFVRRRPGALSAFEFVSRAAMERTLATEGATPNPFGSAIPAAAVLAEWSVDADEAGVDGDGIEDDVDAAFAAGLITDGRLVDPVTAWSLRHRVSEALRTLGVVLGHDVSVPRAELMEIRQAAIDAVAVLAPHAVMCDFGHAGDGGLHLNVLFPHGGGAPPVELRAAIRRRIDELVIAAGGSYSAEHGLGPLNAERWLAATPAIERRLVAALKDAVDPHRLLGHPGHPYNLI
jgi:FAD/FMN-containing dehydrogenase